MTSEQAGRIEDFLEGRMDPEEQKRFERDLLLDEELAAAYGTYRAVEKYMLNPGQYAQEEAVKNTLSELGAEYFGAQQTATGKAGPVTATGSGTYGEAAPAHGRVRRLRFTLAAAALLAVCVAGSWYVWQQSRDLQKQITALPSVTPAIKQDTAAATPIPPAPQGTVSKTGPEKQIPDSSNSRNPQQQLFAVYFRPDTLPANREDILEAGFELYEKKQYKQAADALEDAGLELSTRGEETDRTLSKFYAAYYQALSYMVTDKDAKAIALLKGLTAPGASLQAKADWYLALCYVRTNRWQEAVPLLRKISNNREAGAYKEAAGKLLAALVK